MRLTALLVCFVSLVIGSAHVYATGDYDAPGDHTLTMALDGWERTYIVHVPSTYKPQVRVPLVIMLHGGGGTAKAAMHETGWAAKADKAGFLAVFPNALARNPARRSSFSGNPQLWNDGSGRFYSDQTVVDDVRFITALLDTLSAHYAVDKQQIFLTGFSNGASMSFLAGAQLSDRIAAIAPVAGALWIEPPTFRYPVPMLYITGTADPLNLIEGGVPRLASGGNDKVHAKAKPPVRESILKWGKALGCPAAASVTQAGGVRTETYSPCMDGSEVVYTTVEGMGHTWAGGKSLLPERMVGKQSNSINATDVIWDFFRKQAQHR